MSAYTHWTLVIFNNISGETLWSKAASTGAVPTKTHAEMLVTDAEPSIVSPGDQTRLELRKENSQFLTIQKNQARRF